MQGFKSIAGIRAGSGNGIASGAYPQSETEAENEAMTIGGYDQIDLNTGEDLNEDIGDITDENDLTGGAGLTMREIVSKIVGGSLPIRATYENLDALLFAALGFEKPLDNSANNPSPINMNAVTKIIDTGIASGTCVITTSDFSSSDVGKFIRVRNGNGAGQVRRISGYNSGTSVNITPDWSVTPSSGDVIVIEDEWSHLFECTDKLSQMTMQNLYSDYTADSYSTNGVQTSNDKAIRRLTAAIKRGTNIFTYPATMINSLELNYDGENTTITVETIPYAELLNTINTSVSSWGKNVSSLSTETNKIILPFDWDFKLGDYDAVTGLISGDQKNVDEFTITINNNLRSDNQDSSSGQHISEPKRDGKRTIEGNITFGLENDEAEFTDFKENTTKMLQVESTGVEMNNYNYALDFYLPKIKITSYGRNISGTGYIPKSVDFMALNGDEGVSGMPNPTITSPYSPIMILTQNRNPFNQMLNQNKEY